MFKHILGCVEYPESTMSDQSLVASDPLVYLVQ